MVATALCALALCALAPLAVAACGSQAGAGSSAGTGPSGSAGAGSISASPSATSFSASPSASASFPEPRPKVGTHPLLLLDSAQWDALRAAIAVPGSLQQSAWRWFLANEVSDQVASHAIKTYRGHNFDHFLTRVSATTQDGQTVRDWGVAYQLTGDAKYAARVRQVLLDWAAVWRPTDPTMGGGQDITTEAGNKQSPGIFGFAWAYDMTASSDVYLPQDRAKLTA